MGPHFLDPAGEGSITAGCKDNLKSVEDIAIFDNELTLVQKYLLSDPQTSGGLLISVKEKYSDLLLDKLKENNINAFIVGKIVDNSKITIS